MIAYLNGRVVEKKDNAVVIDTHGVGYEVFCSNNTMAQLPDIGGSCQLFVHTQYRSDGASLFGFVSTQEKTLFLSLIKVDSVGPKSALNIMSAAAWDELVGLIEDGDVGALSKLPKISKKTAEHVVVKLKGKLSEIFVVDPAVSTDASVTKPVSRQAALRKMRAEAQTALSHLGYRIQDVDRTLDTFSDEVWGGDLQSVIRHALNDLSGNI
jgi:Holliday junction DNA helicase RuvA